MSEETLFKHPEVIVEDTKKLIWILEELGVKPILWAGTLLGAVREKKLIAGDSDMDIAYISKYEDPHKVHEEVVHIYKELWELGILEAFFEEDWNKLIHHPPTTGFGQAHLTLNTTFGEIPIMDFFTTWKQGGRFYDPWFGDIGKAEDFVYKEDACELYGVKFPGLENPEPALVSLYGEDWRTPKKEKGTKRNKFRCALKLARVV
jgi:hypothetical protein